MVLDKIRQAFTTFHSSILAEETSNNEIIEEAKELIEDTEVVEIRQDDPLVNVFKEYILSKGETIDISGDVFVGVKTGDIITVQFNSSASDTNVTIFEMQYDLTSFRKKSPTSKRSESGR
ncbi:hypothetical protein [Geobacillus sp. LYN3]|uniref:hypothetical protein n=1 Tax=Geobacillus sp. LYN3 TaxID=2169582 RepID=UPI0011D74E92